MKLYHYYRSSASYRVRIALALKGLSWEPMPVHLGELQQYSDEYRRVVPSQAVPVLVDDEGVMVAQSLAIIEYLDEVHSQRPLLPSGARDRAYVRELAMDIGCDIHPLNNTRVLRRLGELGLSEDERSDWYRHWIATGLLVVETKLQRAQQRRGAFCLGDEPGVADCFLVPQVFNAKRYACALTPYPVLMQVFERCMALSAFRDTQPAAYEPAVSKE